MRPIESLRITESCNKSNLGSAITIGVFDGLHRGHIQLINTLKDVSKDMLSVVVTFSKHPLSILDSNFAPKYLCSVDDRLFMLNETGVDQVIPLNFDEEIASLSAETFVQLLCNYLKLKLLIVGPGFALGRKREGDVPALKVLGEKYGFTVIDVNPLTESSSLITSTSIREALKHGSVVKAAKLLGRNFTLKGQVVKGEGIGHTLGFPTANILSENNIVIPGNGIYATWSHFNDGTSIHKLKSATSIGVRPTFGKQDRTVESYVLDYEGDLYGKSMTLEFVERIRDEIQYDSVNQLTDQMKLDVRDTRKILDN
ncbi:MAG: bifunctional riboflavin kinase/FMN adenylyltransferase [Dehalococcoidia bacterium]|nr:bifunctional riboflavin kinase/FMN adenylyltransferase [Dehalococcoidia bacterium]MQG15549.1 bifunctional riboflavin kinase/FAD synthetase [SAR202 cluster bacterium]|tara:strand:+ start:20322 stop:21260 length:939 start_codon:yes stop_codon:yes gene_type:complete